MSMLSSHAYQVKIGKYTSAKIKVNSLKLLCGDCISTISAGDKYFQSIFINGEHVGLKEIRSIMVNLLNVKRYLDEIVNECDEKIQEYVKLKKQAEEREKATVGSKLNNNNNNSNDDSVSSERREQVPGQNSRPVLTTNYVRE